MSDDESGTDEMARLLRSWRARAEVAEAEVDRLRALVAEQSRVLSVPLDRRDEAIAMLRRLPAFRPDAEQETRKVVDRSVEMICLCDKHAGIEWDEFVRLYHCPLCCAGVERLSFPQPPAPAVMVQCITGDWHAFEDGGDAHRFRHSRSRSVYQIVTVHHWTWHPARRPDVAGEGGP